MGSGTGEEQASRGRKRACLVPVSIADEVTKTILNSPKALTASSDRCYCPQQSNTTVWIRRSKNKNDKKRVYREDTQSSVEVQTDTQTPGRAGNLVMFRPGIRRRERRGCLVIQTNTILITLWHQNTCTGIYSIVLCHLFTLCLLNELLITNKSNALWTVCRIFLLCNFSSDTQKTPVTAWHFH